MFDEETVVTEGEVDFFDTGSVPVPPAEADAHRAVIDAGAGISSEIILTIRAPIAEEFA